MHVVFSYSNISTSFRDACISLQKVYAQFLILYTTCYHSRHCGYALTTSMCESRIFFPRNNNYVCSCRDENKKAYFLVFLLSEFN